MPTDITSESWRPAGADLIAFALGLAVAWVSGWTTTDLVWSLWLSSLVVGYAIIVWTPLHPLLELIGLGLRDPATTWKGLQSNSVGTLAVMAVVMVVGAAFYLAFFTVHFGGFHFISASFLMDAFPIQGVRDPSHLSMQGNLAVFKEVFRRYWFALPSAFLAQRAVFARRVFTEPSAPPDVSVTAEAIAARKAALAEAMAGRGPANGRKPDSAIARPYANVFRMHVVIIALGGVHAARLDNFAVYAGVYALYFFPWRLLKRRTKGSAQRSAEAFVG
jgi:hypothetical protein